MNLRTTSLFAASAAALLVAGTAAPAERGASPMAAEKLAKALAGRAAGVPVSCISERSKMQVVDDWTILFRDRGIVYVQKPRGGCHGLSNSMSLVRSAFGTTRICSGDINQVIDPRTGFGAGACVYSEFVPYRKAS